MWTEIWKRNSISKRSNGGQVLIIWKHFGNEDEKHNRTTWGCKNDHWLQCRHHHHLQPLPCLHRHWLRYRHAPEEMEVLSWSRNMSETMSLCMFCWQLLSLAVVRWQLLSLAVVNVNVVNVVNVNVEMSAGETLEKGPSLTRGTWQSSWEEVPATRLLCGVTMYWVKPNSADEGRCYVTTGQEAIITIIITITFTKCVSIITGKRWMEDTFKKQSPHASMYTGEWRMS